METRSRPVYANGSSTTKNATDGAPSSTRTTPNLPSVETANRRVESGRHRRDSVTKPNGNLESHTPMKNSTSHARSTDRVIESFQQTMQAFLEVQKSTMLAYLAGRGAADTTDSPASHAAPSVAEALPFDAIELSLILKYRERNWVRRQSRANARISTKRAIGIGHSHESNGTGGIEIGNARESHAMTSSADGPDRTEITDAAARDCSGSDRLPDRDTGA